MPPLDLQSIREYWNNYFIGDDGYITAWTFVPNSILAQILDGSISECPLDKANDEDTFMLAYEWMKDMMDKSGLIGRKSDITPWWCWVRAGGGYTKPTTLNADEGYSLIEIRLRPDQVLLSDFHFWHLPLNYWINLPEEESDAFDDELKLHGLNIYRQKPLPEPFHSRVQDSWSDLFILDCQNGFTYEFEEKAIQGVFWKLTKDMIVGVVEPDTYIDPEE